MKYFIRGLGVGIIITALLLCIFYRKQMTDSAIIRKAKLLGMDFVGDNEQEAVISQGALSAVPTAAPTDVPASATATAAVSKTPPTAKPTAEPKPDPTIKPTVRPTEKPAVNTSGRGEYHSFTIKSGLLSSSVAKQMEEAGIISNAKEFDSYLTRNGYGDQIRSGKFRIPKGAGYAEIARIITN